MRDKCPAGGWARLELTKPLVQLQSRSQEMVSEKIFLLGQEKSGYFTLSQGKLKSLKEVREIRHFKSTYSFFSRHFYCFITFKTSFVHFTDMFYW